MYSLRMMNCFKAVLCMLARFKVKENKKGSFIVNIIFLHALYSI